MLNLLVPALALIAFAAPTPAVAAPDAASDVTDVSAQAKGGKRGNVAKPRGGKFSGSNRGPTSMSGPGRGTRNVNIRGRPSSASGPGRGIRNVNVRHGPSSVSGPGRGTRNVNFRGGPGIRTGQGVGGVGRLGLGPGRAVALPAGIGSIPTIALQNNRFATVYRGPRRIYWGGRWRAFVPLTALGVVAVGSAYYYPDAYLALARPACSGVTPNGCQLNWQRVGFQDGDGEMQCVQFCPRPGAIPPPKTVALAAPPPPAPDGKCEITIYSEPKFASNAVPTSEDQPRLSESGWQNQIASVQVKSGTWEMFTEEQFSGAAMRLGPGSYPEFEADWTKKINSFMCVEPGN